MATIGSSLMGPRFYETDEVLIFQIYLQHHTGARAPAVNARSTALPPQYVLPTLTATPHTDLPPPSLFMPTTLSFHPPATLLPVRPPSLTPGPIRGPALDVQPLCGPHLHMHPPSPVPPSHLALHHSCDEVITDHPRCTVVAEAASPPATSNAPCTHHHHPWGRMAVGQDGKGGHGGEDAHGYILGRIHCCCGSQLTFAFKLCSNVNQTLFEPEYHVPFKVLETAKWNRWFGLAFGNLGY